eukprot:UN24937
MSACFSLNHGCVTALLALAVANFGDTLGGFQTGTLYIMYVLSALFCSATLITVFGTKWSLVSGVFLYSFYIVCFLVAAMVEGDARYAAALIGAGVGGIAAGNIWTAQGSYFGESVATYVELTDKPSAEVTSTFGSRFATIYLTFEVACKLLTSLVNYYSTSKVFLYTIFSIFAVISTVGMVFIRNMTREDQGAQAQQRKKFTTAKAFGALNLLRTDRRMLYMYPAVASFGVLSAFVNSYVTGKIVTDSIGKSYIGYLGSTVGATAAVCSILFS